ncbi:MAG TPA: hypothetical protein VN703_02880 [Candidatus Sulfopaludibacter sp.]|nr:hypothetical protein [Candidatus Sulfopaludibacter sp.]
MQKKLLETLQTIGEDAENDAEEMDGKPFTGKIVATYFGYHGAAIKALADILIQVIEKA